MSNSTLYFLDALSAFSLLVSFLIVRRAGTDRLRLAEATRKMDDLNDLVSDRLAALAVRESLERPGGRYGPAATQARANAIAVVATAVAKLQLLEARDPEPDAPKPKASGDSDARNA